MTVRHIWRYRPGQLTGQDTVELLPYGGSRRRQDVQDRAPAFPWLGVAPVGARPRTSRPT